MESSLLAVVGILGLSGVWGNIAKFTAQVPVCIWAIVVAVGLLVATFIVFHKLASRLVPAERLEETLSKLGELRTDGVNRRNEWVGSKPKPSIDERDKFIEEFDNWKEQIISEMNKISHKCSNLHYPFSKFICKKHRPTLAFCCL